MKKFLMIAAASAMALPMSANAADVNLGAQVNSAHLGIASAEMRRDRYNDNRYDNYREGRRYQRAQSSWQGRDGRYYCKKDDGTTGLLVGAGVGGLIGNEVAGRGDKTIGTVIGAVGGALLGRAIDRSGNRGGYSCR